jgi:DNA-3-methyladenine glycosylase
MKLPSGFYDRPALDVARDLIGTRLLRRQRRTLLVGRIVETEAYVGPYDLACHASKGRTARTEVMFGPPGHAYVYLIYGMHCCLNVVTGEEGYPAAVLIRAIEPLEGVGRMTRNRGRQLPETAIGSGPGKLCQALAIDRRLNGESLEGDRIWLEAGGREVGPILRSPRIGVDYAGAYRDKRWRFFLADNPHVSPHSFNREARRAR